MLGKKSSAGSQVLPASAKLTFLGKQMYNLKLYILTVIQPGLITYFIFS